MTHAAVVVPASDEQDTIAACLASIDATVARARASRPTLSVQVIVVLDRCLDGTAGIVRGRPGVDVLVSTEGRVGAARGQGSRRALSRSPASWSATWTAHTDADSTVPVGWLTHQLDLADGGADLVLGTVLPDLDERLLAAWHVRHDTGDGHLHVHGANLGIRADALDRLGGWGPFAEHEDAELVGRAVAAGLTIRRTGGDSVTTSGRLVGRTGGGFAGYLQDLVTGIGS